MRDFLVHTVVKTDTGQQSKSYFTCEDYDTETDSAEQALRDFWGCYSEQFLYDGGNRNSRIDTNIFEKNEEGEIINTLPAWVSFNEYGFYLREIPVFKPISRKPAELSDEIKEEARLMNTHIAGFMGSNSQ